MANIVIPIYYKTPSEVLDYTVDWKNWLETYDKITDVVWSCTPTGLTLTNQENDDNTATTIIAGGTSSVTYTVTCKITTDYTLVGERSFQIIVVTKR